MNFYKYERSRSFADLGPGSLRFNSFNLFSKTTKLIETKLHVWYQWGLEIEVCLGSGSHDQDVPHAHKQ